MKHSARLFSEEIKVFAVYVENSAIGMIGKLIISSLGAREGKLKLRMARYYAPLAIQRRATIRQ